MLHESMLPAAQDWRLVTTSQQALYMSLGPQRSIMAANVRQHLNAVQGSMTRSGAVCWCHYVCVWSAKQPGHDIVVTYPLPNVSPRDERKIVQQTCTFSNMFEDLRLNMHISAPIHWRLRKYSCLRERLAPATSMSRGAWSREKLHLKTICIDMNTGKIAQSTIRLNIFPVYKRSFLFCPVDIMVWRLLFP